MQTFADAHREVLAELGASGRNDRARAESAVLRLFRSVNMPTPEIHWAKSVHAAIVLAESWRPRAATRAESDEVRADEMLMVHVRRARGVLEASVKRHMPGTDSVPNAGMEIPSYLAALLETEAAVRRYQKETFDPREYYRLQAGQSLEADKDCELLSFGELLFLDTRPASHRWLRSIVSMSRAAQVQAAVRLAGKSVPKCQRLHARAQFELARDAYWVFLTDQRVVLADPPLASRFDRRGRPHCDDGPALITGDGAKVYATGGVWLPEAALLTPDRVTVKDIELEPLHDTRALMIERFGLERYLTEAGAILWHRDECGELYFKAHIQDHPLLAVRVRNSTPEPDGSYRKYTLRVPPHVATAREAVAWTFGLEEADYQPSLET